MGQYYYPYIAHDGKVKIYNTREGLKLTEHSWWNAMTVGNITNELFYKKGQVCWVGDYYDEDNYAQVNCDEDEKDLVRSIGDLVWKKTKNYKEPSVENMRLLNGCLLVNHTKQQYINCDEYYEKSVKHEVWHNKTYGCCLHPIPLLTCSANHSGGCYCGINEELCGTWFDDTIEVVLEAYDEDRLIREGYTKLDIAFKEKEYEGE